METVAVKTKWSVDPAHSEVSFKVKHLMITNVSGSFEKFTVEAETAGDDFSEALINFKAETASVTTHNEQRDIHLRSADFFDAEKFPELSFTASGMKKINEDSFEITGDLTLKGVTKKITLIAENGGVAKDPWGNTKAGFTITGSINRKDFGLVWNAPTEAGGLLVSEAVKIHAEIQMIKAI